MIDSFTARRAGVPHPGLASRRRRVEALVWAVPACIAVVYLVVFATQFSHDIALLGWISDYAFAYIAPQELARSGIGGHVNLGTYGSYAPLWFGLLTARLPLHRELWQLAPTALFLLSAAIVAWSVAQVASRRLAMLALALMLVASPVAWGTFMTPADHNTAYPCTALLGAYLVWLARGAGPRGRSADRRRRASRVGVPLLVAIVVGVCLASDELLIPVAIAPLALTAALASLRRDPSTRRIGLTALASVVGALPVAWATSTAMASLGFATEAQPLGLTPLARIPNHLLLLSEGLRLLFNGYLGTTARPGPFNEVFGVACDVTVSLALLAMLVFAGCAVRRVATPERGGPDAVRHAALPRDLHVVYWAAAAATACGAYVMSDYYDSVHWQFYATTILSVAAVVPLFLLAPSPLRWLVPAGSSVFLAASLVGLLIGEPVGPINTLLQEYEPAVLSLAQRAHATVGYAGYEGASSLTWSSHERLLVRPVLSCPGETRNLCRAPHDTIESWYAPRPRHTFLLLEPSLYPETSVTARPTGLGPPIVSYRVGPILMYVYPYDIATRVRNLAPG